MRKQRPPQNRIPSTFTAREQEVLKARAKGETYAAIAARLGLSPGRIQQIVSTAARRRAMIDAAKSRAARSDDPLDTPVELLPLSTRSINALRNHGVATLRDLGRCTRDDILRMKNLGVASVREIQESVRRRRRK